MLKIFFLTSSTKREKTLISYSPFTSGVDKEKSQGMWEVRLRPGMEHSTGDPSSPTFGCEAKKGEGKGMQPVAKISVSNMICK